MGVFSRLMLSPADKYRLLSALRADIVGRTAIKNDNDGWIAAQHDYRLAEAIARPKRGVRPHKLKAYDWYFWQDNSVPLRDLDLWIDEARAAQGIGRALGQDAPGTAPPPAASGQ